MFFIQSGIEVSEVGVEVGVEDGVMASPAFPISNDVMTIPPTEQGSGSDNVIPDWIKSNAGWWADGQIDDSSFVSGLQWLISNGIMKIS